MQAIWDFQLSHKEISGDELTEFREAVEVTSARLAAVRRSESDLKALELAVETMARATSEEEFHEGDIAFHAALAKASGNGLIDLVLDSLRGRFGVFADRWFTGRNRHERTFDVVTDEHRRVLEAVRASDPDAASKAMRDHLSASRRDLADAT